MGWKPEEIAEALMVCVNPCGMKVLTYGVTCMLEAIEEIKAEKAAARNHARRSSLSLGVGCAPLQLRR